MSILLTICFSTLLNLIYSQTTDHIELEKEIKHFTTNEGLASNKVYGVVQDSKGYLYFFTEKGISKFDGYTFTNFDVSSGLPSNNVWMLTVDSEDRVWIHTHSKNLCYLKNDSIHKVYEFKKDLYNQFMVENGKDSFLIQNHCHHQLILKGNSSKDTLFPIISHIEGYNYQANRYSIYAKDKFRNFLINSKEYGVKNYLIESNSRTLHGPLYNNNKLIITDAQNAYIFNSNQIRHYTFKNMPTLNRVYEDRSNIVWACTKDQGVYQFIPNLIKKMYTSNNISKIVRKIQYKNELFIKDSKHKIHKFNCSTRKLEIICSNQNLINLHDWFDGFKITSDLKNLQLNDLTFKVKDKLPSPAQGLLLKNINDSLRLVNTYLLDDKNILVQSSNFCLNLINRKNKQFAIQNTYITNERIQNVFVTNDHRIFLLTQEFLKILDNDLKLIIQYSKNDYAIPSEVSSIIENSDRNEVLIASNSQGIFSIDKNNNLRNINNKINYEIEKIVLLNHKIYVLTYQGIYILEKTKEDIFEIVYCINEKDGLIPGDILDIIACESELFVTTSSSCFSLANIDLSNKLDSFNVTGIFVNNVIKDISNYIQLKSKNDLLKISLNHFPYLTNDVYFECKTSNQILWNRLESNQINISNIHTGITSIFMRMSSKSLNKILDEKSIEVEVPIKWYESRSIFIIACVLGAIIAVVLIRNHLNKRFKLKNSQKLMEFELRENKLRALESQMNPHFIYNALGSVLYFIQENKNSEAESYLTKLSKLIRSYLTASRNHYILLKDDIAHLETYILLEQKRYSDKFRYEINIDPKINNHEIEINSLMLQPIVENAIQHGLFEREEGGILKLSFLLFGNDLIVSIQDNGKGFIESTLSSENKNSIALKLFNEKLEILNKIHPERRISYSIYEADKSLNLYKGTLFTITFHNVINSNNV